MGETTIQWCDFSFNPWVGCQRVSPGCTNCYAETYDKRVGGVPKAQRKDPTKPELRWGPKAPRVRTSAANWRKPLQWNAEAAKAKRRDRVFCASLADVFEDRPELVEWRAQLLDLIVRTPHLDWLLLTKRPESITRLLRSTLAFFEANRGAHCDAAIMLRLWLDGVGTDDGKPHPPTNLWLGTTVEDQQRANERIPELLKVPVAVRFLSCEPLLGPVDLSYWLDEDLNGFLWRDGNAVQWVIIGGESGHHARPFDLAWAQSLVVQCRAGGVAPFVKQLGANPAFRGETDFWLRGMKDRAGGDMAEWPPALRVREFPR